MKIGYIIEGISDEAFITGLRNRWCKHAKLEPLAFRGTALHPRKYPGFCKEGQLKGCDVVIVLKDSDEEDLNTVYTNAKKYLDAETLHYVIVGVPVRNIECWMCANPEYIASRYNCEPDDFRVKDPKAAFERALNITNYERQFEKITALVQEYPSLRPMLEKSSFKRFYDNVRDFAQQNGCQIPNEWDT